MTYNERFKLLKIVQEKDNFGGIVQSFQDIGEFWCEVLESDGFFKESKNGKKRIQTITLQTWLNRDIDHTTMVIFNEIKYCVVNAVHSRKYGVTTFNCEFNN